MIFIENIKFAFSSLWDNKIRSGLTMLGVIIGVFSVITLVSIGVGLSDEFSTSISDIGSNMVIVASGQIDTESEQFNPVSFLGSSTLSLEDVDLVKEQVPHIEEIAWTINLPGQLEYQDKVVRNSINFSTQENILEIMNYDLIDGRALTEQDLDNNERVLILGGGVTEQLTDQEENLVGEKISMLGEEFEVIGTLEKKESAVGFGDTSFDNLVIMPFSTGEEIAEDSKIFRILMKADAPENVTTVAEQTNSVILKNHDDNEDFSVLTQEEILDMFNSFLNVLTQAISGIAAISLIVGGIGIMNIMLVSVTERTREIGIRKAIGATSRNILTQFLVEAATLSLIGGGIGVGLSFIVGQILSSKFDLPTNITLEGLLLALGISIGVGIIFGLMPAIKAARKHPIEALRYE